jgi:hypothetical protein
MKTPTSRSALFSTLLLVTVVCGRAEPVLGDEAQSLFDKGNAAYDAGKYETALEHFASVWKLRRTHDLAATMAQAEMKLGRYAAAAEHLRYALAHFPLTGKTETKKRMEAMLADAKARVGAITVRMNVPEAAITVDGTAVDGSLTGGETFLSPGQHVLEASAPGYMAARQTIDAKAGIAETVTLMLIAASAPGPTVTGSGSATAPPPPPRSMVPAYVLGGVSIASLVAGGVLLGVGFSKRSEVQAQQPTDANGQPICYQFPPAAGVDTDPRCAGWRATAAEGSTLANAGVVLLGVGAAAAGVTLGYIFWPTSSGKPTKSASQLVPVVGPSSGGLVWSGAF